MSLDFEKYVVKGVIGDLSVVVLYTSSANWKMKSGISSPGHFESETVQSNKPSKAKPFIMRTHGKILDEDLYLK